MVMYFASDDLLADMVNILVYGLVNNSWENPNLASAWYVKNVIENLPGAIVSITSVSTEVLLDLSIMIAVESWASLTSVSWGLPPSLTWTAGLVLAPFVDCGCFSIVLPLVRFFDKVLELGVSAIVERMLSFLLPGFAGCPEGFSTLLNIFCPSWDIDSRIGTLTKFWADSGFLENGLKSDPSGEGWWCLEVASYCRPEAPVSPWRIGCDRTLPVPLEDQLAWEDILIKILTSFILQAQLRKVIQLLSLLLWSIVRGPVRRWIRLDSLAFITARFWQYRCC